MSAYIVILGFLCQAQLDYNKILDDRIKNGEPLFDTSYSICEIDAYAAPCDCWLYEREKKAVCE